MSSSSTVSPEAVAKSAHDAAEWITRDRDLQGDLAHTTWIKYHEAKLQGKCEGLNRPQKHSYIKKICKNFFRDHFKKQRTINAYHERNAFIECVITQSTPSDIAIEAENDIELQGRKSKLNQALPYLSKNQRRVMELVLEGKSQREIEEHLSMTESQVHNHKHKAMIKISKILIDPNYFKGDQS